MLSESETSLVYVHRPSQIDPGFVGLLRMTPEGNLTQRIRFQLRRGPAQYFKNDVTGVGSSCSRPCRNSNSIRN